MRYLHPVHYNIIIYNIQNVAREFQNFTLIMYYFKTPSICDVLCILCLK